MAILGKGSKKIKKILVEISTKGLTHPPLVEKKIKRRVVFWAFQLIWDQKIFLNFFTLKISNLSYSLILSLLGIPNFGAMWQWGLVIGSDWWWVAVVHGGRC